MTLLNKETKMNSLNCVKPLGKQIDEAALAAKRGEPGAFDRLLGLLDRYILKVSANFMDGSEADDVAQELRLLLFRVLRPWEPGKGREFRQYYIGAMKKHLWKLKKKATRFQFVSMEEMEENHAQL